MLPINEEIRIRAGELELDVEAVYLFCFALQHNLVGYLIEKQLITKQNEHDYRINFTEVNGDGVVFGFFCGFHSTYPVSYCGFPILHFVLADKPILAFVEVVILFVLIRGYATFFKVCF